MARYNISIKKSAVKELENIPKKHLQKIAKKIQSLSNIPRPQGSQKLSHKEQYRVRQGDYRIVHSIQDKDQSIEIVKVGHRKDVYRSN